MAHFDKLSVLNKMAETAMIPVFYNADIDICKNVVKACYNGGVRVFEFTNRGDYAHEVFSELNKWAVVNCPDLAMGVGSVIDGATAALYIQMGANFIVGPLFSEDVAFVCNKRQVSYCPGCGTVTEIGNAQKFGCEVTKLFPGDVYGPAMAKDVLAPMPWTKIMVTGGVSPDKENLEAWFKAGVFCVGMGSKLFPKDCIKNKDWDYITNKCKEVLSIINGIN